MNIKQYITHYGYTKEITRNKTEAVIAAKRRANSSQSQEAWPNLKLRSARARSTMHAAPPPPGSRHHLCRPLILSLSVTASSPMPKLGGRENDDRCWRALSSDRLSPQPRSQNNLHLSGCSRPFPGRSGPPERSAGRPERSARRPERSVHRPARCSARQRLLSAAPAPFPGRPASSGSPPPRSWRSWSRGD